MHESALSHHIIGKLRDGFAIPSFYAYTHTSRTVSSLWFVSSELTHAWPSAGFTIPSLLYLPSRPMVVQRRYKWEERVLTATKKDVGIRASCEEKIGTQCEKKWEFSGFSKNRGFPSMNVFWGGFFNRPPRFQPQSMLEMSERCVEQVYFLVRFWCSLPPHHLFFLHIILQVFILFFMTGGNLVMIKVHLNVRNYFQWHVLPGLPTWNPQPLYTHHWDGVSFLVM